MYSNNYLARLTCALCVITSSQKKTCDANAAYPKQKTNAIFFHTISIYDAVIQIEGKWF